MSAPAWLGPVVRSYRMTPAPFDIAVAVVVSFAPCAALLSEGGRERWAWAGFGSLVVGTLAVAWIVWSTSSTLHLHAHGVALRRIGERHDIPYGSIHPASIATYSDISGVVSVVVRVVPHAWHIHPTSTGAISFVGPSPGAVRGPGFTPPPAPGDGFVLFASRHAEEIAQELRVALVAHGVPQHLAWWSASAGPLQPGGFVSTARDEMPGYRADWRP